MAKSSRTASKTASNSEGVSFFSLWTRLARVWHAASKSSFFFQFQAAQEIANPLSPLWANSNWVSKFLVSAKQNVLLFCHVYKTPLAPIRLFIMIMDKTLFSEHLKPHLYHWKVKRLGTNTNNHERSVRRIPFCWGRSHRRWSPTGNSGAGFSRPGFVAEGQSWPGTGARTSSSLSAQNICQGRQLFPSGK